MKYVNLTSWSWTSNSYYDENALANAIANIGPIAVGIYVSNAFNLYSSGIFSDSNCNMIGTSGSTTFPYINHAVRKHFSI
jgi:acetaldehyde dehydrogenase (acetylating)